MERNEKEKIVFVRLRSGETRPANRANLAKRLQVSQRTAALFGERPGQPSAFGQSGEVLIAEIATDEFRRYGPNY